MHETYECGLSMTAIREYVTSLKSWGHLTKKHASSSTSSYSSTDDTKAKPKRTVSFNCILRFVVYFYLVKFVEILCNCWFIL